MCTFCNGTRSALWKLARAGKYFSYSPLPEPLPYSRNAPQTASDRVHKGSDSKPAKEGKWNGKTLTNSP
jgi:hypothetical protein